MKRMGSASNYLTVVPWCLTESDKIHNVVFHLQDCGVLAMHHGETGGPSCLVVWHASTEYHKRITETTKINITLKTLTLKTMIL